MKVSIIIASFNKAKFLFETISSVLSQSYKLFEVILIDDCSNDETIKLLPHIKLLDPRIKVLENDENRGANYCRNVGLQHAQGEYILFLDADDLLAVDCLKDRINAANDNPEFDMLVFTMGVFHKKVGDDARLWKPVSPSPLRDFLQHKLPWSILQPLWKKTFLQRLGGFDESFLRLQDVELHTRALLQENVRYILIPGEPDCFYRIDEERKNFHIVHFLERWIDSAVQYCNKFEKKLPDKIQKYLSGTLFQVYLQILYQRKVSQITQSELQKLETKILNHHILKGRKNNIVLRLTRHYNLLPLRIPGINRLLKTCILLK